MVIGGGALVLIGLVLLLCVWNAFEVGKWLEKFFARLDRRTQVKARENQFRQEWAVILTDLCGTARTGKITSVRATCRSIITLLEPLRGEASPYVDRIMVMAATAAQTGRLPDPPTTTEAAQELSSCIHQVCRRITA